MTYVAGIVRPDIKDAVLFSDGKVTRNVDPSGGRADVTLVANKTVRLNSNVAVGFSGKHGHMKRALMALPLEVDWSLCRENDSPTELLDWLDATLKSDALPGVELLEAAKLVTMALRAANPAREKQGYALMVGAQCGLPLVACFAPELNYEPGFNMRWELDPPFTPSLRFKSTDEILNHVFSDAAILTRPMDGMARDAIDLIAQHANTVGGNCYVRLWSEGFALRTIPSSSKPAPGSP